jgi:hypothetical protein
MSLRCFEVGHVSLRGMSDSPVSDVMAEYAETRSPECFERFLALFRSATVGFVAVGAAHTEDPGSVVADGDLGAGRTTYGDGRPRLLAYADPEVALRNFGPRFNAGMSGEVLLQIAATDADCHGILVNSATREISLIIDKPTAQSLLR